MNSVYLSGYLATDPDLSEVLGGFPVAVFMLEVKRNPDESDFFRVKYWTRLAAGEEEHLALGQKVTVEGMLRQDPYDPARSEGRGVTIIARQVECL